MKNTAVASRQWMILFPVFVAVLLAGAAYNRSPIVFPDSYAYLHSAATLTVPVAWPIAYGLFVRTTQTMIPSLWWTVVVQSMLLGALIILLIRNICPTISTRRVAALLALLAVGTGLPWISGQLIPDFLAGCLAVTSFLLIFRGPWSKAMTLFLGLVFTGSLLVHYSHPPIMAFVIAVLVFKKAVRKKLLLPAGLLALALILTPAMNKFFAGEVYLSMGGHNLVMCRLIRDRIVHRLLDEHCADRNYALCAYKEAMRPLDCNDYLRGSSSPLIRIGGWASSSGVSWPMIIDAVRFYPLMNIRSIAGGLVSQVASYSNVLFSFDSSAAIYEVLEKYYPRDLAGFRSSRQLNDELNDFLKPLQAFHWMLATLSLISAVIFLFLRLDPPTGSLLRFTILFCLANAAVCSAFSEVAHRYQWRVVWLIVLSVAMAAIEVFERRKTGIATKAEADEARWPWSALAAGAAASVCGAALLLRLVSTHCGTTPASQFSYLEKPVLTWPRTDKFTRTIPLSTFGDTQGLVLGATLQAKTESGREFYGMVTAIGKKEITVEYSWERMKW